LPCPEHGTKLRFTAIFKGNLRFGVRLCPLAGDGVCQSARYTLILHRTII
jgi:hypothetical protein